MPKTIHAAEMDYSREESEALREELIQLRNKALDRGDFGPTVRLSHAIAWMAVAIDEIFGKRE